MEHDRAEIEPSRRVRIGHVLTIGVDLDARFDELPEIVFCHSGAIGQVREQADGYLVAVLGQQSGTYSVRLRGSIGGRSCLVELGDFRADPIPSTITPAVDAAIDEVSRQRALLWP